MFSFLELGSGHNWLRIGFSSSLRRHYPVQVQRVDGDEAILSAGSTPAPRCHTMRGSDYLSVTIAKSLCLFEEVSWPVRPFCCLWGRAEVYF